jgi:transcriptional regulator with XRE-family HTH domain
MSPSGKRERPNEPLTAEDQAVLTEVGLAIRAARQAAGLTQQAAATKADVQRSYLAGVETGTRNVSVLSLARIARALGTDIHRLLAEGR